MNKSENLRKNAENLLEEIKTIRTRISGIKQEDKIFSTQNPNDLNNPNDSNIYID